MVERLFVLISMEGLVKEEKGAGASPVHPQFLKTRTTKAATVHLLDKQLRLWYSIPFFLISCVICLHNGYSGLRHMATPRI